MSITDSLDIMRHVHCTRDNSAPPSTSSFARLIGLTQLEVSIARKVTGRRHELRSRCREGKAPSSPVSTYLNPM